MANSITLHKFTSWNSSPASGLKSVNEAHGSPPLSNSMNHLWTGKFASWNSTLLALEMRYMEVYTLLALTSLILQGMSNIPNLSMTQRTKAEEL
jgi:hypothetical protein